MTEINCGTSLTRFNLIKISGEPGGENGREQSKTKANNLFFYFAGNGIQPHPNNPRFPTFLPGPQHRPHRKIPRARLRSPIRPRPPNRRRFQRRRHLAGKQRFRQNIPTNHHHHRPRRSETPLIIYIHGGAFSLQSAFSSLYHNYANSLASQSRSVVVSIEYRLAPEHPIPACYDDCYAAVKWIGSHTRVEGGPDPWLNEHADFNRVYAAGDSAGANLAHNIVTRADVGLGFKFAGLILVHPFFGIGKPDKLLEFHLPRHDGVR
ncbi:hypothetical protein DH2020_006689 [Rehmannia glutinosa]|uniref:Alpha/beta hydrolase fold-3 domain-containing protein n=1 Tax=Rehmannia glutinosa TaxID=99300 RepID=A0ABR0XJK8_REHGL